MNKILLKLAIASVWLINGLFCKILNFVPRHQEIVSDILGNRYALLLTFAIGFGEIFLSIWILTAIKSRYCAIFQIFIVLLMNIIEFVKVPDLLLFGKFNLLIAILFCSLIYFYEFQMHTNPKSVH